MISSNDLRPGLTIEYRDNVCQVIESMHVKPGKGSAFVQTKLKNLETGEVLKVNFRAAERLQFAEVEKIEMIYLYKEGNQYVMMDSSGCESIELAARCFGENVDLLCEGLGGITTLRHNEKDKIRVDTRTRQYITRVNE